MFRTRVWKGKRNAGRMGRKTRTVKGLLVWKVVPKYNLVYLMVSGVELDRAGARRSGALAISAARQRGRAGARAYVASLLPCQGSVPGSKGNQVRLKDSISTKQIWQKMEYCGGAPVRCARYHTSHCGVAVAAAADASSSSLARSPARALTALSHVHP